MGISPNALPHDTATQKYDTIEESGLASTDDHLNDQVIDLSKKSPEVKDAAEQSTSLKDYFVCSVYLVES
jgi:hypothetical protein